MRNTLALIGTVAGVLGATPAFAQSAAPAVGTVLVNGSVADRCLFTLPSRTISLGELALGGTGATAGRLDPAKVNGRNETLMGWCNGTAATMSVEAQPLLNTSFTGSAPAGFDTRVNFSASALANSATATDTSIGANAPGTAVSVGLFTGNIVVTLSGSSTPNSGLLVAGTYAGQVLVTLTPNVSFGGGG